MLTMGQQLTPEQRLSKCVVDILGNPRYVALNGIVMIGERAIDAVKTAAQRTACTNGRDEWYHPDMVNELPDAQLRFVILHECKHKMYRHLITWKNLWEICPHTANMACDYVINLELLDENKDGFAVMPEGKYKGLADSKFKGMNAKQVFDIIYEEQEGGGGGGGQGFDEHDWEGAEELTDEEKHQLERDIDVAIRQGALAAGKIGGGDVLDINDLLKPQVDWRSVLREFVQATCAGRDYSTYAKPNRRFMSGDIYMPSSISETIGSLVVAPDMSGSTGIGRMRQAMLTETVEVAQLMQPSQLRLMYWDTEVYEEVYQPQDYDTIALNTHPTGGGGTTVECVSDYIADNRITPQAVVIMTDGYLAGGWGNWACPVLWLIVDNPECRPPHGKILHIDSTLG